MIRLFFYIVSFFIVSNLNGQNGSKPISGNNLIITTVAIADTSNYIFFNTHSNIQKVRVGYLQEHPRNISLFFTNDKENMNSEIYDLGYEVDMYVFKKRYEKFNFPQPPTSKFIYANTKDSCNTYKLISAIVYFDSVQYSLNKSCVSDINTVKDDKKSIGIGWPAKYRGDLKLLAEIIQLRYNKLIHTVIDSAVVFKGIVDKGGYFRNIELFAGTKSPFSEFIKKELEKIQRQWIPAKLVSGLTRDTDVRIYFRLNNDESITILTSPRKLLTVTGK